MTTALDDRIPGRVKTLITRLGKDATVTVSTSSYDPATGLNTPMSTTHTVKITPPAPYGDRFIDGDLVRRGDLKVILAADGLGFTPAPGQLVTFDSKKHRIERADAIYSGELVAAYEVQLRG